jgi:hypothetical protein
MIELQVIGIILFIIVISVIIIISLSKYRRNKFNKEIELQLKERKLVDIWFKRNYKKYSEDELDKRFNKYIMNKHIPMMNKTMLFSQYSSLKNSQKFKEPIQHIVE